ncbi:MAG: ATP-binding protein [Myxococcota bacterium]
MHGDLLIIDGDGRRLARFERLESGRVVHLSSSVQEAVEQTAKVDFACILVVLEGLSTKDMEALPRLGRRAPVFTFGRSPSNWPFGWSPKAHHPRLFEMDALEAWIDASLERIHACNRARTLERQLLHSERLIAVGQLAAGVAHEVNNPAAYVTTNLCLLEEQRLQLQEAINALHETMKGDDSAAWLSWREAYGQQLCAVLDETNEIVRENLEGMGRISSIVRDLKNFSRIERASVEVVHPNEIVNAACNLVQNQIRHKARLIREAGDVPAINADRNKLTQVLTNLLLNAAHAIPEGDGEQHMVRIRTWCEDEQVRIEVSDTGRGIPPALQVKIFEPFFTTKNRDKGTGLGLALCADIVGQHAGSIEVQSKLGYGASFSINLPIANGLEPSRVELTTKTRGPRAERQRSGRLLVIDDEVMLIRAYRRSLGKRYDAVFAEGGQEALDILAQDDAFDVIVCDLMMPRVDGIRVFEHAKMHYPQLVDRFVFCSGGAFTPRAREFCAATTQRLLEKPLTPKDLDNAIQQALADVSGTLDVDEDSDADPFPPFESTEDQTRSLV